MMSSEGNRTSRKGCKARRVFRKQSQTSIEIKMIGGAIECSVVYEHVFFLKERHKHMPLHVFISRIRLHFIARMIFTIYRM